MIILLINCYHLFDLSYLFTSLFYLFFPSVPTGRVNFKINELLLANCSVYFPLKFSNCHVIFYVLFLFSVYIGIGVAAGILLIVVVLVIAYFVMKNKK